MYVCDKIPIEICHECAGPWEKSEKFDVCPYCGVITMRRVRLDARNEARRKRVKP